MLPAATTDLQLLAEAVAHPSREVQFRAVVLHQEVLSLVEALLQEVLHLAAVLHHAQVAEADVNTTTQTNHEKDHILGLISGR